MKQQKNKKYQVPSLFGWFLTIGLVVVSILPFFSFLFWPLELLSHFYLQYAFGFVGLIGFWLLFRKPVMAVASLFGFLFSFIWLLPFFYQPQATAGADPSQKIPFTLVFNNLNYQTTNFKPLLDYVDQKKPMVVALVEIPTDHYHSLKQALTQYPYSYYQPGVNNHLGLAVFSQLPFNRSPYTHYFGQSSYPSLELGLERKNQPLLTLIVVHPPPPLTSHLKRERDEIFSGLAHYLAKKQLNTVVVGDFNATSFSPNFRALVRDGRVIEGRLGRGVQPSWPTQLPWLMRIPIDHALVTLDLKLANWELGPDVGSDHLPFSLTVLVPGVN